jgi:hypothetical protein
MTNAADGDRPVQREAVALLEPPEPTSPVVPSKPARPNEFRGFFGYLEFDFDPDAPGGVPGFGAISNLAHTISQAPGD